MTNFIKELHTKRIWLAIKENGISPMLHKYSIQMGVK